MRLRPASPLQRRCIIDATVAPLVEYRRGYSTSKAGPFYSRITVNALVRNGALRPAYQSAGHRTLTALAKEHR